jgi:Ca-activated chloride channel family protein
MCKSHGRPLKGLIPLTLLLMPSIAFASVAGEVNKANELYKQGRFDDSLNFYQEALDQDDKSPVVKYDLGTALYKKGDYAKALGYLEQAAEDKNIKIKPKAEYNLGNVLYKSGKQKENTNIDQAMKSLQEALGHYGQTIAIDPKDQEAVFNQDFVKKEIERLKQKKQQQKQQQNQQQQQNQKQQKQNQQNQQSQQSKQNQQKQQGQESRQNQQKQQENQQAQQSKSKEQKNQKQKNDQAKAGENQKELDRKQAEDLLEDYQENEEPKKLLNYMPKKIDDRPVLKDW